MVAAAKPENISLKNISKDSRDVSIPSNELKKEELKKEAERNSLDSSAATMPRSNKNTVATKKITSGLSLRSIQKKKEIARRQTDLLPNPDLLPNKEFTETQMVRAWQDYGKHLDQKGERIMGALFAMNLPKLSHRKIEVALPNTTMQMELEAILPALLAYLHKKLENHSIEISIVVNAEISKKYAFTTAEKYEKLKSKNPLIDKLRSLFDLDL